MPTFGGNVRFAFDGNPLVMRGHITIEPSNFKSEGIPNQDGSVSRTLAPKGFVAKCKFEDSTNGLATPQPWGPIIRGGPYNITVIEELTGQTHMFTGALFTGDATVDREKGEVDGLGWIAAGYTVANF